MIEVRQLDYVLAIARAGTFTQAARDLHMAQPALSAAIRRLEDSLGVALFERTTRHVRLTPAGEAFVERADDIARRVTALGDEMAEHATGLRGRVRLSAWYQLEPRLAEYVASLVDGRTGVEVGIVELSVEEALARLRSGDVDVAQVVMHEEGLDGIEAAVLRSEPYVLALPAAHPLARRSSITAQEIAALPLVVWRPGTALRACVDRAFHGQLAETRKVVETAEPAAALAFVAAGVGVAVTTPVVAAAAGEAGISTVPIADVPPFVLSAAWRSGPHSPVVQHAIDLLLAGLRST